MRCIKMRSKHPMYLYFHCESCFIF
uniref:Uncharacterized protein n=1 Tax=Anguilla anguilla TaxID=7936 RepID=A0A0E9XXI7_ANGAN